LDQHGSRIREDKPASYKKNEDIQEARRVSERPIPRRAVEVRSTRRTCNCAIRDSGIGP